MLGLERMLEQGLMLAPVLTLELEQMPERERQLELEIMLSKEPELAMLQV